MVGNWQTHERLLQRREEKGAEHGWNTRQALYSKTYAEEQKGSAARWPPAEPIRLFSQFGMKFMTYSSWILSWKSDLFQSTHHSFSFLASSSNASIFWSSIFEPLKAPLSLFPFGFGMCGYLIQFPQFSSNGFGYLPSWSLLDTSVTLKCDSAAGEPRWPGVWIVCVRDSLTLLPLLLPFLPSFKRDELWKKPPLGL